MYDISLEEMGLRMMELEEEKMDQSVPEAEKEYNFEGQVEDITNTLNELASVVKALEGIIPEDVLAEADEAMKEAHGSLGQIGEELKKLKELGE